MAEAGGCKTQYRFYHSNHDDLAPVKDKLRMINLLEKHGFNVQYFLMGKDDIDGVFVKNLKHGMDLSLKTMFTKLYPTISTRNSHTDIELCSEIVYPGHEMNYVFRYEKERLIPAVEDK